VNESSERVKAPVDRQRLGRGGEALAARLLEAQGFTIRASNVHVRGGELDLVAERGVLLCFVEVRMRSRACWGDPAATVTHRKQRRVIRAARRYLAAERIQGREIRFDVITVLGEGEGATVQHIPNAFDAGG
jgi:putative endonuclease